MTDLHTHRCMICTWNWAPRWCPSRAMTCRCSIHGRYERTSAYPRKRGLFDVSHMGQVILSGAPWDAVATAFESAGADGCAGT